MGFIGFLLSQCRAAMQSATNDNSNAISMPLSAAAGKYGTFQRICPDSLNPLEYVRHRTDGCEKCT
jgi:hypothetical protein